MSEHLITALTAQKRNPQRINVYLDGEFAFGLTRLVAAWLAVGQKISDEKIAQLKAEDTREKAYQQALNLLNYRARSEAEIRQKLKGKTSEEVIQATIDRLSQAGLLDDQRFAQEWVENRSEMHPRSRRALAFELRKRGVNPEAAQQALSQLDEPALALQAAQQQARKYQGLDWPTFRQKMYAFLARRGFNYEHSAEAARQAWASLHAEDYPSDEDSSLF